MKLSIQAKRMLQVIVLINLISAAVFLLYYRSAEVIPCLLGLLLGGVTSVGRVILLEKTVNRVVGQKASGGFAQISYLSRFGLALIALLIGAMEERVSLLGVVIGVLSYQIGAYSLVSTLSDKQNQIKDEMSAAKQKNNKKDF